MPLLIERYELLQSFFRHNHVIWTTPHKQTSTPVTQEYGLPTIFPAVYRPIWWRLNTNLESLPSVLVEWACAGFRATTLLDALLGSSQSKVVSVMSQLTSISRCAYLVDCEAGIQDCLVNATDIDVELVLW